MVFFGLAGGASGVHDYSHKKRQTQSQAISEEVKFKAYWSAIFLVLLFSAATNKKQNEIAVASALKATSNCLCFLVNQNRTPKKTEAISFLKNATKKKT